MAAICKFWNFFVCDFNDFMDGLYYGNFLEMSLWRLVSFLSVLSELV
jgi:hypothetical protein